MKLHSPETKYDIVPKAFSIFPLFVSLALLHGDHIVFKALSGIFFLLTLYTFFCTRYEKYIDTDKRLVVRRLDWLFIHSEKLESLEHFKYICICLGGSVHNSNWTGLTTSTAFDVVLVRKHAPNNTHAGTAALVNFLIAGMFTDIAEAKEKAVQTGKVLNMPVKSDSELIKLLSYDPLQSS